MRVRIALPAILIASPLGSSPMATAQTGEFASQVPGSVIHNAWSFKTNFKMPDPELPSNRQAAQRKATMGRILQNQQHPAS